MSGITLIPRTEASIPTPAAGKVTFFINADESDSLAYMDDARVVTTVDGATGVDGVDGLQGPPGVDGVDGEDGLQGPPGEDGTATGEILNLTTAETDDELVLKPDGVGGVVWGADLGSGGGATAFIGCKVYKITQTLTDDFLAFDDEVFDTDSFHDNVTNNTRLTVPAGMGGKYLCLASAYVSAANTRLEIFVNGAQVVGGANDNAPGAGYGAAVFGVLDLAAGDYVQIKGNRGASATYGDAGSVQDYAWASLVKFDSGKVGAGIGCSLYQSAAIGSLAAATYNPIAFNAETFDTDGFHDNATNNSLATVPAGLGGKYLITAQLFISQTGGGYIYKNGTLVSTEARFIGANGGHLAVVLDLAAGDYIELREYHPSGTGTTYDSGEDVRTRLQVMRLDSGSVAPMTVRGQVSSAGAVVRGSGFSAAKIATGHYTVTFSPGFSAIPVVVATSSPDSPGADNGVHCQIDGDGTTTTTVEVWGIQGTTGNATDTAFNFIAMAVA